MMRWLQVPLELSLERELIALKIPKNDEILSPQWHMQVLKGLCPK
jgi:hypothetical protein